MSLSSQRYGASTHTMTGSGIPVVRPVSTYTPNPAPSVAPSTARTNYPSNSHVDSRDSMSARELPLSAYRYIETGGSVEYRAANIPGEEHRPTHKVPMPDIPMISNPDGTVSAPTLPRHTHPNFTTSSNTHGAITPDRLATEEYRYFGNSSRFTNQFSAGTYRSFSLSTAKDQVPHRDYFSTP